jgi:8-oxo-dGTP diphosphatase
MTTNIAQRPQVVLTNRSIVLNHKGQILLIQRAQNDSWKANYWELPGGKLDEGQDISHALEREAFEETGLLINPISRTAFFESSLITSGKYTGMPYIVIIGISLLDLGSVKLSEEHQNFVWVPIKETLDYDLTEETKKALVVLKKQVSQIIKKYSLNKV